MRLNKWLALLLAALLCGVLNGALAEADVGLDGLMPEAASLEVAPLEDGALDALSVPEDLELDVDAALGEIEPPAQALDGVDAQEAPAGEAVANWEPYELLKGETRDEHGEIVETYTYFYDEADNCYRILKGKNVRIINLGYDLAYKTEKVTIPGKVGKYRVTEIGDSLLAYGSNTIRTITIPNTVKKIGRSAFRYLRGLKSVTIPKSVTSIGDSAFEDCDYLTSVTIPGSVKTLGNGVFSGCKVLAKVKLNKGLKTIGEYAFDECAFSSITLPDTVTSIGKSAFYACANLKSITIPKSVKKWGEDVFSDCSALTSVTFKAGCTSVPKGLFYGLNLKKVNLPDSVTTIGANAFQNCKGLETIKLPKNLKSIGTHAFSSCESLGTVKLPKNLKSIGAYAFSRCEALETVKFPKNLMAIGDYAFAYSGLKKAILPGKLKTLGKGAFYDCNNLTTASVPFSVRKMGDEVFYSCDKLKKLTISPKLFEKANADNVTQLVIPSGVKSIPASAFKPGWEASKITQVTIPATVKTIGKEAFSGCWALKKVIFKEGLKTIGEQAFYNTALTAVTIPASVTSIGRSAFDSCSALKKATFKEGLKTIGEQAFYNTALTAVTIPASVTSIGKSAFDACNALKKVTFNKGLKTIGASAFSGTQVTAVSIPSSVTGIGDYAFFGCAKLAKLTLNEGLKTIGTYAFSENTSLVTVVIPASVKTIGNYAFSDCGSLTSITIPKGTELGEYALDSNLTVRTYYNSPAEAYAKSHWLTVEYLDAPTSITLNFTGTVQLEKRQSLTLVPTLSPEGCAPYVTWESSNTDVAEVSYEGEVSTYAIGKATITVYDANGKAAASVDIEVVPPKPTSVSIDCWYDEIGVGETTTLYAEYDPYDAEATLTWSSSNTGVATVDQNGVVTGVSAGTTVITVKTDNGLSATQEITVVDFNSDY